LQADYRGARGSNAGDDFHELWAVRQALTLLSADGDLKAVTLEGIADRDAKGSYLTSPLGNLSKNHYPNLNGRLGRKFIGRWRMGSQ
jgi:hypothetical protein